jgi:hypothetical protein
MSRNKWNQGIRESVINLLLEAGFSDESSVIHQLECMNFDAPAEVAQGEAVEVVGYQWLDTAHYRKHLPNFAQNQPNQDEFRPLMTVAQHNRIVSAQRIKMCIALKERNDARAALTAPQPDAELVELAEQANANCLTLVNYLAKYRPQLADMFREYCTSIDARLASL